MKIIIKVLQEIIVIVSTIVANQNGELVPDRTAAIRKLIKMHTELEELKDAGI